MRRQKKKSEVLEPRDNRFVAEFLKSGNATASAEIAGFGHAWAHNAAYRLLRRQPIVDRIKKAQEEVMKEAKYDLKAAMDQAQEAIEFAKLSPQGANAYVKAVELRAKLSGLLIERTEITTTPFSINIGRYDTPKVIESEVVDTVMKLTHDQNEKRKNEENEEQELLDQGEDVI